MSVELSPPASSNRLLRQAIGGERRAVALGSLLLMVHQVAEALVPVMVGVIIDRAVATGDVEVLLGLLALLAVLFVVLSNAFRVGFLVISRAALSAEHEVRLRLAGRVLDPAGSAGPRRLPGELLSIATSDARHVGQIAMAVAFGGGVAAAIVAAAVVLLMISLPLGLLVVLGLPPLLVVVNRLARPLTRRASEQQEQAAEVAGLATDLVTGLRVLKGAGAQDAGVERYRRSSRRALAATLRAARMEATYEGAVLIFTSAFLVLVTLVAGRLATQGQISIGELIAAVGLTQFLIGPLQRLSDVGAELARSRASAERVAAVLSTAPAIVDRTVAPSAPARGRLLLRGVTYGALRDLTVELSAGSFVSVMTTDPDAARSLLACLAREVDPADGTLELDDVAYDALALEDLRRAVLVAPHDAELFGGTLAENLTTGSDGGAALDAVLTAAVADEVVASLPYGLDSSITERGQSLSGGQRQRIALARALLAAPAVLVLQDPTTAVDAATEARIASGLRGARAGLTTIVLTSSPALLAASERVLVIEHGAVVASGTHAELLARLETYRAAVLA
ncbi:MAG: ABC transporter ATP-binding protein/permease [Chloroflexi bacterium]|nr:ABC transporter ATP-binding protein/permease [Chloroflexota bacterium]